MPETTESLVSAVPIAAPAIPTTATADLTQALATAAPAAATPTPSAGLFSASNLLKIGAVVAAVYLFRKMLAGSSSRGVSGNPRGGDDDRLTISDISQWIDNDEGLYNWWRSSRQSKSKFIRENRAELESSIRNVTSGKKPAHYLAYGSNPRRRRKHRRK